MKQHYVSKFIVEGFVDEAGDGNRGVWVFNSKVRRWAKRPTRRTASSDDFYTLFDQVGQRDDALEALFESVETPMAMLLRKDLMAQRPIAGRPASEDLFIHFCSLLIARNPAMIDRMKSHLAREGQSLFREITASDEAFQAARSEYQQATGKQLLNIQNIARLRDKFAISATKAGGLLAIGGAELIAEKLSAMTVDFLIPTGGGTFITGDIPYVLIGHEDHPGELDQVIIPLAANFAAVFNSSEQPLYEYVDVPPNVVSSVNRAILTNGSEVLISKSPDVFPVSVLERWASSDEAGRVSLVIEMMSNERGA